MAPHLRRAALAWVLVLAALIPGRALAAILNGRITDPTGIGVHPLDIDVRDSNTQVLLNTPDDTTDAAGNYSIVVPAGKYDVTYKPTAASHLFRDTRTGISVSNSTTINRTLPAGRLLSGRTVATNGTGVAGAHIRFHDAATGAAPANVQDDFTDAQGFFGTLVSPGTYAVEILPSKATRKVPQEAGTVALTTVDQALGTRTLASGHLVTGTITDASLFPIANADFDVQPSGHSAKVFTPTDNTDGTGTASFVIPPGVYDVSGNPPPATAFAASTARSVSVTSDMTLPNLALPPGVALSAHCVNAALTPIANVDCDADSLPLLARLHTAHDASNAAGDVSVQVSLYKFRVNYAPPVATKLLPVVFDSLQITKARSLGNLVHPAGHWVSVNVREQFTNLPLEGANLDFVDAATGKVFLTIDDVTNHAGFTRVVTDQRLFNLVVRGPSPAFATLAFAGFRTLNDTTLDLAMSYDNTAGVDGPAHSTTLELAAPWPNPARGSVRAAIVAPVPSVVELTVLDPAGRRVARVFRGAVFGRHDVTWDARDMRGAPVAPGSYLLCLSDGRTTHTRRVAVMR